MPTLTYQRFLESDPPPSIPPNTAPMWSWPLPLSDGSTLLTLLYRPLSAPNSPRFKPATQILHLNPQGDDSPWQPALAYPAPVLFYANAHDHLLGLDLSNPKKIYACTPTGQHVWTLETPIRLDNLLAPANCFQHQNTLHWTTTTGTKMSADLSTGIPTDIRPATDPIPKPPLEIRHPHTHLIKNSLYILDFDPMPRITRHRIDSDQK